MDVRAGFAQWWPGLAGLALGLVSLALWPIGQYAAFSVPVIARNAKDIGAPLDLPFLVDLGVRMHVRLPLHPLLLALPGAGLGAWGMRRHERSVPAVAALTVCLVSLACALVYAPGVGRQLAWAQHPFLDFSDVPTTAERGVSSCIAARAPAIRGVPDLGELGRFARIPPDVIVRAAQRDAQDPEALLRQREAVATACIRAAARGQLGPGRGVGLK